MAEQYIGIPWLIQALKYLFANEKLIGDQLISSRLQAMIGLYMPDRLMNQLAEKQKNSNDEIEMISGRVYHGRPGEKPEIIEATNSIKDVLDPLQKLLLHAISMTVGISYQAVTRDLVKVNMASGRINANEDKKTYRKIEKFVAKELCQRDWDEFVFRMVIEGKTSLTLSAYLKDPWKYHQAQWRGPGYDMIDPHGEALANIELWKNGLLTKEKWYGEQGDDWRASTDQWIEEQKYLQDKLKEKGVMTPEEKEQAQKQKAEPKNDNNKLEYIKEIEEY
jgi:capsid protein